ncbi:hypothetical protein [Streptomyces sp. NPDC001774]
MGGMWLADGETELTVLCWQYTAGQWAGLLKRHGFTSVRAEVLPDPDPAALGTFLVTAMV